MHTTALKLVVSGIRNILDRVDWRITVYDAEYSGGEPRVESVDLNKIFSARTSEEQTYPEDRQASSHFRSTYVVKKDRDMKVIKDSLAALLEGIHERRHIPLFRPSHVQPEATIRDTLAQG